jgi:hypothetical protein
MKFIKRSLALVALLGITSAANAQIAVSTFDTDADGWTIGEFFSTFGGDPPSYLTSDGNPGGFIQTSDLYGWNAFHAPAKFLGDKAAAYGGSLRVDQRLLTSDNTIYPMVVISDGTLTLQFRTPPPQTGWTIYNITLLASAGWEVANGSGNPGDPASEEQLIQVLSNLVFMNFDGDWQTGSDLIDLDNVRLDAGEGLQVSGQVQLQGANSQAQPVTLVFRSLDGGEIRRTITPHADGSYVTRHLPRKPYTIWIKGAKWLADKQTIDLTNGSVSNVNFTLLAGDANDDNFADITDLLAVVAAYNQVSPAPGFSEAADFNGDSTNDITDLLLLIGNYNKQGESLP